MPRKAGAGSRSAKSAPAASSFPAHDEIARRAYELWVNRGMGPGLDRQDWHQAEQELLEQAARKVTKPRRLNSR
jgi:Protein of unknown function (DUF2934)